ncbi:MAG: helix-hairpin-helix domain-containing protein [Myxococcaceae bacterium]
MRPVVAAFVASLLVPALAFGAIYESVVDADDEEEIFAMYQRGDISLDTADTLLELLREGVDLNSAPREKLYDLPGLTYADCDKIIAYRTQKGRIEDPTELVGAEAITAEQLIGIAAYIRLEEAKAKLPVSGKFRAISQYTLQDPVAPPALLAARLKGPLDLSAGFMATGSRLDPTTPKYDSFGQRLVSEGIKYRLDAPRFFLQWQNANRRVIVGTYAIGFGERLTLDNSRRTTPRGLYLTDDFRRSQDLSTLCRTTLDSGAPPPPECMTVGQRVTADYSTRDVFRGVAGSIENLELGDQRTLSLYGFLSYQSRSIYQYDLYDKVACPDPSSGDAACTAPRISVVQGQNDPGWRLRYSTLPTFFDELAGGGHVDFKPSFPLRFGLTGYGSVPFFNTVPAGAAVQPDFQDTARYPNGGAFGAIGVDAQAVVGDINLHLEVSRSFDRAVNNQGGGWAALQRSTYSPKGHELELVLRYYDNHFLNPYARPFSGPDEDAGQRARNEAGARLRYFGKFSRDWQFRTTLDFWVLPYTSKAGQAGTANLTLLTRVDFTGWKEFKPAIWFRLADRNLAVSQRGVCQQADVSMVMVELNDTSQDFDGNVTYFTCDGYRIAQRVDVRPMAKLLSFSEQASVTWRDDISSAYNDKFRVDLQVWFEARSQPVDWLSLRLRSRYLNQGIDNPASYEENLWTYLEAAWLPIRGTRVALRYDLFVWLDQRASTAARVPSPEHRFLVDLRTSF